MKISLYISSILLTSCITLLLNSLPANALTPDNNYLMAYDSLDSINTRVYHEADQRFYYDSLSEQIKSRITGMSFPSNFSKCRITYDDLRYLRIIYYDYTGSEQEGELIVNRQVADDVLHIFFLLYTNAYQLASVRLVDDFGEPGKDYLSMSANNTSAFNYRTVSNSKKLSWHSFGCAIDINPVENPYIDHERILPPEGAEYTDRSILKDHMITYGDYAYKVFSAFGWKWGGDFTGDKDYQHFYKQLDYTR